MNRRVHTIPTSVISLGDKGKWRAIYAPYAQLILKMKARAQEAKRLASSDKPKLLLKTRRMFWPAAS
jgi:hypothetical protein